MEPIGIDIESATAQELYQECVRLGIKPVRDTAASQMRIQLRLYERSQKTHAFDRGRWAIFAEHLGLVVADDLSPKQVAAFVFNHLYERLVTEGYVSTDFTSKPISEMDDTSFYITGRLSEETVSTACPPTCPPEFHDDHGDSCAIWYAACCAFADVSKANTIRMQWEADHKEARGGN